MPRIIDPDRFILQAGLVDWQQVEQRTPLAAPAAGIAAARGLPNPRTVQLRWLLDPRLGYPSEPFRVWRRPSAPFPSQAPIPHISLGMINGWRGWALSRPAIQARLQLNVVGASASVLAFSGAAFNSAVVGMQQVANGAQTVIFSAGRIVSLLVQGMADLLNVTAVDASATGEAAGWQLVEVVGLPVDPGRWSGVRDLGAAQGLAPAGMDPRDAARARFARGAPFYGWRPAMAPGRPAPPWTLADPDALLQVFQEDVLPDLQAIIRGRPPATQWEANRSETLPLEGGAQEARATYSPMEQLVFAAASDPLVSLIGGFGTAYADDRPATSGIPGLPPNPDPNRNAWDWMVTARYADGPDDRSPPVELAAIASAPRLVPQPPPPHELRARTDTLRSPATTDQSWRPVVRLAWDKLPDSLPVRAASFAAARAMNPPGSPAQALMGPRRFDTALQPISATTSEARAAEGRLEALDDGFNLPSLPTPFPLIYGVTQQDIFGLWSNWATRAHSAAEPAVGRVPILSARLEMDPPSGAATVSARLVVDFSWDWQSRSPREIRFVGRLYAQAELDAAPPDAPVPLGLQRSLGGVPGVPFLVRFNGADAGVPGPGGTLRYIDAEGQDRALENLPIVAAGTRHYRLVVPGFTLNFNTSGRIGLALYAMAQEERPPQRQGAWSPRPSIASAADPRPPASRVEREDVPMASLGDASGLHHASLDWAPFPGAVGYNLYTVAESRLRTEFGLGEAAQGETLSQRLATLRQAFRANPLRQPFARLNDRPVTERRQPVVLPRGTREIHLYIVLGVSAGGIESDWPDLQDPLRERRLFAFAAPQVVAPAPPRLEVQRVPFLNGFRAAIVLRAAPGATASRLMLHRTRVAEAARSVASMGAPLMTFPGAHPGWTVEAEAEAGAPPQPLALVAGNDAVPGSWQRVFYRCVAEAADDPERGIYGTCSDASGVQEVVIPPAGLPVLVPLSAEIGANPRDVTITTTTTAPVEETPLGPHRLRLEVFRVGPAGRLTSFFVWPPVPAAPGSPDDRLAAVPTGPGRLGSQNLRRSTAGTVTTLRISLRRPAASDPLRVRVMLTDPLGRARERVLDVEGDGALAPAVFPALEVQRVEGQGFLISFEPDAADRLGTLDVAWRPTPAFVRASGALRQASGTSVQADLASLRRPARNEDLLADPAAVPLRRAGARVTVALRGDAGSLQLTLTAPDGRISTVTRSLR